ncbi:response regulator [Solicola sp. PLA-1-18]|uniref:response regulator n=1 Tax=Solicola sp. PLA-1-18 TaxID=3380532 RepID=UPI003B78AE20
MATAPPDGPLVLVVDDTASIRMLIRTNLELEGFEVVEAVDGQDCLDVVHRVRPDVITIDVVMPRLDGFATVAALRADPEVGRTPIVMVSTQAQAADIKRGWDAGVDAYVVKPFDPDELVETVRRVAASGPTDTLDG